VLRAERLSQKAKMKMRTTHVLRVLALGALVVGCGDKDGDGATATKTSQGEDSNSASDSASGTSDPMTGSTGAPGTTTGGTTAEGTTDAVVTTTSAPTTGTECTFLECGDMMAADNECDIWLDDCPEGQKCMPYAKGDTWDATKCSPVNAAPGQEGDECTVEMSSSSGIDSCDKHLLCWYVDGETLIGSCINMCTGSEDAPSCPGGQSCDISNDGSLILCLSTCDPLVQSCPEGQICFQGAFDFICDFDASGEEGQYGDACEYINVCDYGLFCATPEAVPGCVGSLGCCSEYCDLTGPNICSGAPMQECVPWYEGEPPPGGENLGACAVPN